MITTRRILLQGATALGAGSLAAPWIHAQEAVTPRYLPTAVNQSPGIAAKARKDLGITIEYIAVTIDDVARRVITQPNSFDLVDTEYFALPNLVPSGKLKGMDARRIERAGEIASVIREATVDGAAVGRDGTAPFEVNIANAGFGRR